jgi:hypothetical protein
MGDMYVVGNNKYDEDEIAMKEIIVFCVLDCFLVTGCV